MPFTPPKYVNTYNLWRPPNASPDPPDQIDIACQLYFTPKGQWSWVDSSSEVYDPPVYLRVPPGTDLQVDDVVEVNAGDGWFYTIRFTERVHMDFPNEYFVAILEQGTTAPPPGEDSIVQEDGDAILQEDGDLILQE